MNVSTATTAELLAFFNANTGGNPVKKFADRKTAERRVQALVDEIASEATAVTSPGLRNPGDVFASSMEAAKVSKPDSTLAKVEQPAVVRTTTKSSTPVGVSRPAMAESLKLDRRIVDLTSGVVYKNACQVWKANVVSSSQCDRLSALLYGAAKNGDRELVASVNGHNFTLEVK